MFGTVIGVPASEAAASSAVVKFADGSISVNAHTYIYIYTYTHTNNGRREHVAHVAVFVDQSTLATSGNGESGGSYSGGDSNR